MGSHTSSALLGDVSIEVGGVEFGVGVNCIPGCGGGWDKYGRRGVKMCQALRRSEKRSFGSASTTRKNKTVRCARGERRGVHRQEYKVGKRMQGIADAGPKQPGVGQC